MADYKILCPACASVLSSKKPIPNGKKITCPHCHKPFVAATAEPGTSNDSGSLDFEFASPAAPAASAPIKADASKSGDRRSHSSIKLPARSSGKSGSNRALIWLLILGLLVLAGGGGAVVMYFVMMPPEATVSQKGKSKKSPESKNDKGETQVVGAAKKTKNEPRKDGKGKGADKPAPAKGDAPMPTVAEAPKKTRPRVADWKEFSSAKGGYTALFPAPPDERLSRDDDIIYYETTTELNGFHYEITFHKLKKPDLEVPLKDRFDKLAAEYKDVQVTSPKECEFEGVPKTQVLELTVFRNDKKDVAVERWMVYKDHLFQVCVCGDKEKLGPDQVSRFMQSFKFVADPQGTFLDLAQATGIPPERKKK